VERAFDVKVVAVNVITVPGKSRRYGRHESTPHAWKKATVRLAAGQSIGFFEGV
jgi:large subunit ribosomal protein L23